MQKDMSKVKEEGKSGGKEESREEGRMWGREEGRKCDSQSTWQLCTVWSSKLLHFFFKQLSFSFPLIQCQLKQSEGHRIMNFAWEKDPTIVQLPCWPATVLLTGLIQLPHTLAKLQHEANKKYVSSFPFFLLETIEQSEEWNAPF